MDKKINDAIEALIRALRDEKGVVSGSAITFSMHSAEGDDQGDWEISVQPTRFPAGKKVERAQ